MKFLETKFSGAYLIGIEKRYDERGYFARSFCREEFDDHGLNRVFVQNNISFNIKKGTLRGMHYQIAPYEEVKFVSCITGAIYDVIVDLRPAAPTYLQWLAVELNAENNQMLYIPEGFAHGFQTMNDDTTVFYQISELYSPEYGRGIRWDDPTLNIRWPFDNPIISEKDRTYPDFPERDGL